MARSSEPWIHSFTVTETRKHKKGYTIYKITSIMFPRQLPETLSCITVWKRYKEIKSLYKDVYKRHKDYNLKGTVPELKDSFFKRFEPDVISERKQYILDLLNFISLHSVLYKSQAFQSFFENGHSINNSPEHKGNIESIRESLKIPATPEIELLDPTRDMCDTKMNELFGHSVILNSNNSVCNSEIEFKNKSNENSMNSQLDISSVIESKEPVSGELENSDSIESDYMYNAATEFSCAVVAEVNGCYKEAFDKYKLGIEILLNGAKDDTNLERKKIAKEKTCKYLERAESIFDNYVLQDEKLKNQSLQIIHENIEPLERPINQLSKLKVIKIIDNKVMQVQDVTDKKIYIMKAIQKPCGTSIKKIFLPRYVPYMTPLIAYFQTDVAIYLLLKLNSGGKLLDYIQSYNKKCNDHKECVEVFETNVLNESNITNIPTDIDEISINASVINKIHNNLLNDDIAIVENIPNTNNILEENTSVISENLVENDKENQNIEYVLPAFELSQEMDINDLVSCSQKLLKSVTTTLNQTNLVNLKTNKDDLEKIIKNDDSIKKSNKKCISKETVLNIVKNNIINMNVETKRKLTSIINILDKTLPEGTIRQWAAELIVAINSLHIRGIICGDLRLDNLLLGDNGQLMLSYFCRRDGSDDNLIISNKSLCNLYCAPERPITEKSDWWSVGVILFELFTGRTFVSCHPGNINNYFDIQYCDVDISKDAKDLLRELLQLYPEYRISYDKILFHPFFKTTDWNDIIYRGNLHN